ncbi:predicted protein [Nematostella vectensis]|uniref:CUB domain-containing protein n=1 Tax=Nematostella vectensis TaxID=45351 RepID=A7REV9_NEMVE|nr:dorsal-ventral patterning tolloid-like protein 1 [Nematostella vectensis]EDO49858.1 predicted protein [Nematostella vectensis]|eukprot:XP_001641921.1 predicted protein [Nematostella vectensis]
MWSVAIHRLLVVFLLGLAFFARDSFGCGGVFEQETGVLRSPASGRNIGEITQCDYLLQVPYGRRIKAVFIDLVLRTPCCSCKHDFVELRDGNSVNSSLIGRFCAQNLPKIIYSTSNTLWLRFQSDFRTEIENKFRLTYTAICGRHFTSSSGSFASPGFPNLYAPNIECVYTIFAPLGRIKIEFGTFDLETLPGQTQTTECESDYVEVKEIEHVEYSTSISKPSARFRRYCGNQLPPTVYSTLGSHIWLRFKSDSSGESKGFSARFRTVSVGEGSCEGKLSGKRGHLFSQNYPFLFPRNKECSWEIEVEKNMHIHLFFDTFNFSRHHQQCIYGYVQVYDGPGHASVIGQFCGAVMPTKVVSRSNKLVVRALSGDGANTGWFSARYLVSSEGPCGPKKFTCQNRQCIDDFKQCNNRQDCRDGSDEISCPPEQERLSWYSFWPVTVIVVMLFMGIWLWHTWKKYISPRSHIERHYCPSPCHHHSNGGISEVFEPKPPSYNEAISQPNTHQTQPPPSYEEAVAIPGDHVTVTTNPAALATERVSNEGINQNESQDFDSHVCTIRTCSCDNLIVGYHRQNVDGNSRQPYHSHRLSSDGENTDSASSML